MGNETRERENTWVVVVWTGTEIQTRSRGSRHLKVDLDNEGEVSEEDGIQSLQSLQSHDDKDGDVGSLGLER